ncbi:Metallo-dependent phosphatase [Saccharata proteae CBS 121410]|uniref:Metallo-dependent phosphatase n=1 Tax=Saccharata proteae CBS 121410 TaxID=1314787 RepID=A0A9P4LVV2_9PEZI|nr:Metallo-dependent phosphatase [Saccharata proteae CBS 121410]
MDGALRHQTSNRNIGKRGKTIKPVKFLVIADTHDYDLTHDASSAFRLPAPEGIDVVLHCGDLTENGTHESLTKALALLDSIPAELKLVIAGNHDISLDKDFYLKEGGNESDVEKAVALMKDAREKHGIHYLEEGTHEFSLQSGASFRIFASPYTPKYGDSAFQYPTNEDRYNPANTTPAWATNVASTTNRASIIPENVDIVMTHGPPKYILDKIPEGGDNYRSGGCEHLRRAIARAKPRLHCFGHIHCGYGAQRLAFTNPSKADDDDGIDCYPEEYVGKNGAKRKGYAKLNPGSAEAFEEGNQTLMVNAAIMAGEDEPVNAPWLVELQLPVGM